MTAAATCRPVLAVSPAQYQNALDGKLIPEFNAVPLDIPESALDSATPEEQLFIVQSSKLPDHLAILDTPDIDSIEKVNWELANHLRAAGDVLIALLTGEKYKDQRVIEFFKQARQSGRIVLPIMNKATPENDFEHARVQLEDFTGDIELPKEAHTFISELSPANTPLSHENIKSFQDNTSLMKHLESLDTTEIKLKVYRESIQHFTQEVDNYLVVLKKTAEELTSVYAEFENRAQQFSQQYDPAPGAAVGGLFHEFVQGKRGTIGRNMRTLTQYTTQD